MSKANKFALLYHNLGILFGAGLPIFNSLDTTVKNSRGRQKQVFTMLYKSVMAGKGLAESMAQQHGFFAPLDIELVKAAEYAGRLPECFQLLSKWYEFINRIRRIMISGFILPLAILHIAIIILPLPKMILGNMTLADYTIRVLTASFSIYAAVFVVIMLYRFCRKVFILRYLLDFLMLKIPVLGGGIRHLAICRYCRAFNMMYKSGIPIIESLASANNLTGNLIVSGFFEGGSKNAANGEPAWQGFSRRLPLEYLSLWQIGEETGELDKTVDKIAAISEDKAELLLTEFAKWLPKIFYFIICIIMAMMVISGYVNLYSFEGL
jgi:type II secretory pathway component PulF